VRVDVTAGVIFSVLSLCISVRRSGLLGWLPFTESVLAFSPGGQAEMAIVALVGGGRCRCRGASSGADRVYHRCALVNTGFD
jgi:hypothetical protein